MKNLNIAFIIIISFIYSGCYDLDTFPKDELSAGTFWQTQDHAESAIMGVYSIMYDESVFGTVFGLDCLSDVGMGDAAPGYVNIQLGTYTTSEAYCLNKFEHLYEGIHRANKVLQNISNVSIGDDLKNQYAGEARFMRALYYFTLLDFFGGVPLYDETTVVDLEFNSMLKSRNSADEVRTFILKDLQTALPDLPEDWDVNGARATKGAVKALEGKVQLYAKNYVAAAAAFEAVVNSGKYALYSSYENLFKPGGDESSEMIFAVQNLGGVGQDYGMPMTFYMGTRASFGSDWNNVMAATDFVDSYQWKDGRPFNWEEVIPGFTTDPAVKDKTFRATLTADNKRVETYPEAKETLLAMYAERDPRMAVTVILPYTQYKGWVSNAKKDCEYVINAGANEVNGMIRVNRGFETYLWRKFVAEYDMDGAINNREDTPINFPIIRYADILLMLAEAYNELDRTSDAVTLVNQVRARSAMPGINSGPEWLKADTKTQLFERIRQERAVELAAEGHRYSDLRRWGLLLNLNGKREDSFTGKQHYTRVVRERDYLWPIPQKERETNPSLDQNPGWE